MFPKIFVVFLHVGLLLPSRITLCQEFVQIGLLLGFFVESCHTGPSWLQDLLPKNAMCANVCTWKLEDMTPHGRVCTHHGCLFQCSHTWTLVRQIMFDTQEMANIHKLLQLTFLFAAMTGKSRLGPDPSISINDLQTQ